jgi:nicotinate dehydrogenase subunit A
VAEVGFTLNGSRVAPAVPADARLLYVLRNQLGTCGTRFGCGAGQCGACMVMIDGQAQPACDTPMWAVEGKSVVTVEGLGSPQAPHALQRVFVEWQAIQCGYCASGILVSAAALLARNAMPTEAEVREALDRHLCRCGMQNRMVRAVLAAARSSSVEGARIEEPG